MLVSFGPRPAFSTAAKANSRVGWYQQRAVAERRINVSRQSMLRLSPTSPAGTSPSRPASRITRISISSASSALTPPTTSAILENRSVKSAPRRSKPSPNSGSAFKLLTTQRRPSPSTSNLCVGWAGTCLPNSCSRHSSYRWRTKPLSPPRSPFREVAQPLQTGRTIEGHLSPPRADSARTGIALGRTGVRAVAVIPLRARNSFNVRSEGSPYWQRKAKRRFQKS